MMLIYIYIYIYFFFYPCYNIEQMNDIVIASEIYESISRNCVDLNELPNNEENNDTCREEIMVQNEYPIEEIGVIEENEDINSIKNKFEPFVGQCFLNEEEAFIFFKKKLCKSIWFYNSKRSFCHKKWRKCKM